MDLGWIWMGWVHNYTSKSIMWDLKCVAAALCFTTSNVLYVVYGVRMMSGASHFHHTNGESGVNGTVHSFNFTNWKELNPTYIEESWVHREASRPVMTWAALLGSMAWFLLIVPVLQSAWILSRGGKRMVGTHVFLGSVSSSFAFERTTKIIIKFFISLFS